MLSICGESCVLYSAGSGVKRVHVVLSGLKMELLVCVHGCISYRYDWMFVVVRCYGDVVCVVHGFHWCLWCWSVRCIYVENVGDRTPPCRTPVLNLRC